MSERIPQGCGYCNHPLFCAIKCPNCGKVFDDDEQPTGSATYKDALIAELDERTEPAQQGTDEQTSGELASGECLPVGADPLPDDVAEMVESLRSAMATDVEQLKAADMLERLARDVAGFRDYWNKGDWPVTFLNEDLTKLRARIAELEVQRDELIEALQLLHDHARLYLGHYTPHHNVFNSTVSALAKVKP